MDVLPTFLAHARLQGPPPGTSVSFLPVLASGGSGRPVLSEERFHPRKTGRDSEGFCVSVRSRRWKVVMTYDLLAGVVTEQAFDLVADPGETDDLAFGTGALPDTLPLGEAFCREVGALRERVAAAVESAHAAFATPYGAGMARVDRLPAGGCNEEQ